MLGTQSRRVGFFQLPGGRRCPQGEEMEREGNEKMRLCGDWILFHTTHTSLSYGFLSRRFHTSFLVLVSTSSACECGRCEMRDCTALSSQCSLSPSLLTGLCATTIFFFNRHNNHTRIFSTTLAYLFRVNVPASITRTSSTLQY
jgi:hypothetical protein